MKKILFILILFVSLWISYWFDCNNIKTQYSRSDVDIARQQSQLYYWSTKQKILWYMGAIQSDVINTEIEYKKCRELEKINKITDWIYAIMDTWYTMYLSWNYTWSIKQYNLSYSKIIDYGEDKLYPMITHLYNLYWESYIKLWDKKKALEIFTKAIERWKNAIDVNPKNAYPYVQIGISNRNLLLYKDAEYYFNKALENTINTWYIEIIKNEIDFNTKLWLKVDKFMDSCKKSWWSIKDVTLDKQCICKENYRYDTKLSCVWKTKYVVENNICYKQIWDKKKKTSRKLCK